MNEYWKVQVAFIVGLVTGGLLVGIVTRKPKSPTHDVIVENGIVGMGGMLSEEEIGQEIANGNNVMLLLPGGAAANGKQINATMSPEVLEADGCWHVRGKYADVKYDIKRCLDGMSGGSIR